MEVYLVTELRKILASKSKLGYLINFHNFGPISTNLMFLSSGWLMDDLTSILAHSDNFHFLTFISDFQKFQNGLEQKLVNGFGSNFFCDVF